MAERHISQASRDALKARFETPEGEKALEDLARLIAETAFKAMPPDLQESLATEEGMAAFREAWPDVVDAFLFQRVSKPAGPAGVRKGASGCAKRRGIPAKQERDAYRCSEIRKLVTHQAAHKIKQLIAVVCSQIAN